MVVGFAAAALLAYVPVKMRRIADEMISAMT